MAPSPHPETAWPRPLPAPVVAGVPPSALAPMQDITHLGFMRLVARYGAPDYYFTEYFRVHEHSRLERHILRSIMEQDTGRPVFAQLIGNDPEAMVRAARQLQDYPIAGVDLNLGCPAPKVYKKGAGGGLLRDLPTIDRLLAALREACPGRLTVKTRIGFENGAGFGELLETLARHRIDLLSVHARTVREMYRGEPHYAFIRQAVETMPCPVLANGNLTSARKAVAVLRSTGAHGVMIGRAAIRNPWIFAQIRSLLAPPDVAPLPFPEPVLGDVCQYVERLWAIEAEENTPDPIRVSRLKKYLLFVGLAVDADGRFLHEMRRTVGAGDFWNVCHRWLTAPDRAGLPFPLEPFAGLMARPSREAYHKTTGCLA